MLKYSLKCNEGHHFDSWFDGLSAFEKLERAGMLSCAICGSTQVVRALMSPSVNPKKQDNGGALHKPASAFEQKLKDLRKKIERESEDVGKDFARQARAMHDGDIPDKAIRGESNWQDAKSLIEDGVPILPLPWGNKKTN